MERTAEEIKRIRDGNSTDRIVKALLGKKGQKDIPEDILEEEPKKKDDGILPEEEPIEEKQLDKILGDEIVEKKKEEVEKGAEGDIQKAKTTLEDAVVNVGKATGQEPSEAVETVSEIFYNPEAKDQLVKEVGARLKAQAKKK